MVNKIITINALGLSCPSPVLLLKRRLLEINNGNLVEIICDDGGSLNDIKTFCNHTGNTLKSTHKNNQQYTFTIIKET